VDQYNTLNAFKKRYSMTATGKPLFSNIQLAYLTLLLPDNEGNMSPQRLDAKRTQTQESDTPTNKVPHPVPKAMETVMNKVKAKLHNLIPKLFLDLVLTIKMSHSELKANAKLEVMLKKKKTLDLAQVL
jgi:hypothetical protein